MTATTRPFRPRLSVPGLLLSALVLGAVAGLVVLTWADTRADAAPPLTGTVVNGTLHVYGSSGDDAIALRARFGTTNLLDVDFGIDGTTDLTFDRDTFTAIDVTALGGNDTLRIDENGGIFTDTETTTLDGGGGNDTILGGSGAETILAGGGNDFVDPNRGNDVAFLGGGADVDQWDPGDGSDTIEGQSGKDVLSFNGSNASENVSVSANGSRVRFFRDVAAVTMDLNETETVQYRALGGADVVNVGDLAGTAVRTVAVDLGAIGGGGDAAADRVIANGTPGADAVEVAANGAGIEVDGLSAATSVVGGEPTNDQLIVAAGEGDDKLESSPTAAASITPVLEGNGGTDEAFAAGTSGDDLIQVVPNGTFASVISGGPGFFSVTDTETLRISGNGGNDTLVASNGLATVLPQLVLDGGSGNDTIAGGDGADVLLGGSGNDLVDSNRGNDLALLGSGNDTAQWDPGDGSDTVEGQGGADTLLFNGSNASENIDLSANGGRVRLIRDVASATMDLNDIDNVQVNTLGGIDNVTVNDLAGTATRQVSVDLTAIGGAADGSADQVTVFGTPAADRLEASDAGAAATVKGLAVTPLVIGAEPLDTMIVNPLGGNDTVDVVPGTAPARIIVADSADTDSVVTDGTAGSDHFFVQPGLSGARVTNILTGAFFEVGAVDNLVVNGDSGNDTLQASNGLAPILPSLVLDGGNGNDLILGGDEADLILGGAGNDFVDPNRGNDTALLGTGNDTAQWDPGDGSDFIDGLRGLDTLIFNGSNIAENIDLAADGPRVRLTRDVGAVTMELGGMENIDVRTLAGADNLAVNDLTGTGARAVAVDLNATGGGDDGEADTITVNGTNGVDNIAVTGTGSSVSVSGLVPTLQLVGAEFANDHLNINTLAGNDRVTTGGLAPGIIQLVIDGVPSP